MKKEHGFLKALCGILIIFVLGIIGTLIAGSSTGGYVGGAVGILAALYIFVIRKPKETDEQK